MPDIGNNHQTELMPDKKAVPRIPLSRLQLRATTIHLQPARLTDAEGLYRQIRTTTNPYTIGIPYPYPRNAMTAFLKSAIKAMKAGQRYLFVIRRFDSDEPLGVVDLINVRLHPRLRSAEIAYWLGKRYWNQGIMTQAVKAVLRFAFETLKLHRVYVNHLEGNDASRRVIEKCWFRREGVDREFAQVGKKWVNLIRYGLLAQEYAAIMNK